MKQTIREVWRQDDVQFSWALRTATALCVKKMLTKSIQNPRDDPGILWNSRRRFVCASLPASIWVNPLATGLWDYVA